MAKKIKDHWRVLMTFLLLTPTLLAAQATRSGQRDCGCGVVSITGEALYWAPSQCDFLFAYVGDSVLNETASFVQQKFQSTALEGDYRNQIIEPQYDWGIRVGLTYERACWFARAQYLWLETNARQTVHRGDHNTLCCPPLGPLATTMIDFETAIGSTEEIYQNFDLSVGRQFCCNRCVELSVLGTLQGICLRERRRVTVDGETGVEIFSSEPPFPLIEVEQVQINGLYSLDNNFLGLGLGSGLMGRVDLGCGLSLVGEGQLLGIVGYLRSNLDERALSLLPGTGEYWSERNPATYVPRTCLLPGIKGRLALEYCYDLCCAHLCAHVGYESHFYYSIVSTAQLVDFVGGEPSNYPAITENAGFGGLNLGLSITY